MTPNININTNSHMLIAYPALTALGLVALLIPTLYLYTVGVATARFPTLRNRRVCLLIAHPDDEDVYVVDDPDTFPDSMAAAWPAGRISDLLRDAFVPDSSSSSNNNNNNNNKKDKDGKNDGEPPRATIDVLITFDGAGVSSHPNHISLYHGARRFAASLTAGRPGWASPVDMYTLTSVGIARKYAGIADVFATLPATALDVWRGAGKAKGKGKKEDGRRGGRPAALVFMHGFGAGGWATAREAMTRAHVSQMVWFRWGWITISRYMFINDLRLEKV
ncbi:hypothetical protein KVR01_013036 [Diaporthe batatas]|uniref:uncharacterized protein n=1 Tax=Diaporthe batatas TaxID=748121 RepID=UPI001D0482A6|nr:uncharacterized protein KVR01_013036 [Diaporthe batatas]KAG8157046.1 hypothetical protein KVR01_013036 [Diaporthe batatas]